VPQPRRSVRLRLAISSIAPGGHGIAHVEHGGERRVVFVPRAAPGDLLEAQVDFERRPARAEMMRLIEPSKLRAPVDCPIAERCGGCDLMFLTREAQHGVHRQIVAELLSRALGAPLPAVGLHVAPSATKYRTRARLAVLAGSGRAVVGYRRAASRHIEGVAQCLVLDASLEAVLPFLQTAFADQRGEGEVAVALGKEGRPVLDVHWHGDLSGTFYAAVESHVESGMLAGAEVWIPGAREPARVGDARAVTLGADGEPLVVPSGGFAQAHPALNIELGRTLLALAEVDARRPADTSRPVVELFAGSGNFTVLLARHTENLVAVESDARAASAARANLAARGLRARVVEGDADQFDLPAATRTVVLDPPRTGATGAVSRLAASKVRRVVYVSCDVTTLARDIETLAQSGFRLAHLEMFEMFPHTSHVEIVAALERMPGAPRTSPAGPARGSRENGA
jgi:23S rRNA (uracil1939-C5)-methyltransferase